MILCMIAVCLVLQPWRETFNPNLTAILLGYVTASLAGILAAFDIITVFYYPCLHDVKNQLKTLFWGCVSGGSVSALASFVIEIINWELPWSDWLLVLGHCVTFVIHMPLYMYASAYIPSLVPIIGSTSTIWVAVAQYTILSSVLPGNRNVMEVLGIGLIICSSVIPSIFKIWRQKSNVQSTESDGKP